MLNEDGKHLRASAEKFAGGWATENKTEK